METDSKKWTVLLHFSTIVAMVLIAFISYMMLCQNNLLNERITRLEKENAELYTMFVAETLAEGESLKKLQNFRNHIVRKYSDQH